MNFEEILKPGFAAEKAEKVTEKNTALAYGSGGLSVYATPAMAALMEAAALAAVDKLLPEGWSTVGTELAIRHLSATPTGGEVRAQAKLLAVNGRALTFQVEAFDSSGKIGEGEHSRFIIDKEKFIKKAIDKNRED
jgi:predicted thioesterase